jgi:DNA end-binding protein Ku
MRKQEAGTKTRRREEKPHADPADAAAGKKPSGEIRAIWTGSVSFGLLQISVNLYSATEHKELKFHELDRRDMSPVGYQHINKVTGTTVERSDIVKAFEYEKDKFVEVTEEDFAKANVEATRTIDIQDFVKSSAIGPEFWETPYFLAPEERSAKAYAVLREALRTSGKAAICTFVFRKREHLCAIIPMGNALILELIRFSHEIRTPAALSVPLDLAALKVKPNEIDMAQRLVQEMSAEWDPEKYKDRYHDQLLSAIHEKARTGTITTVAPARPGAGAENIIDLMSLLKKSIETRKQSETPSRGPANARNNHQKAA